MKKFAALIVFNPGFAVTEPKKAPYATTGEKNAAAFQTRTKKFYECARSKMAKAVVENFVKEYTSQPKLRKKCINYQERINEILQSTK